MRPVMFSLTRGSSILPRVATEIFCSARLMVTASSDGSLLNTSTTERARQVGLSGDAGTGGSLVRLISLFSYVSQANAGRDVKIGREKPQIQAPSGFRSLQSGKFAKVVN